VALIRLKRPVRLRSAVRLVDAGTGRENPVFLEVLLESFRHNGDYPPARPRQAA
jgi:hypothetical protein